MSSNGTGEFGSTNHFGEVFTGDGAETHQGLVVTDGAIVPTALGVNPFATITALAERSVKHTAGKMGMKIDYDTENGKLFYIGSKIWSQDPPSNIIRTSGSVWLPETRHYWRCQHHESRKPY